MSDNNYQPPCVDATVRKRHYDDTYIGQTAKDNPLESKLTSLKIAKSVKENLLDRYFPSWDDINYSCCYPMPFCTNYNRACYETEKLLYDYVCSFNEPMLIINSYQHNTKLKGGDISGVCEQNEITKVDELDLVVVHKKYGLFLFEVKDMRHVTVIRDTSVKIVNNSSKQNENQEMCPINMIKKGETSLEKKWEQIKIYLSAFFQGDSEIKTAWRDYWELEDDEDIDRMLNCITSDFHRRIFMCLFYYNHPVEPNEDKLLYFKCTKEGCRCENQNEASISSWKILMNTQLENSETFRLWWENNIAKNPYPLYVYEFLLNRFGLDYFLSAWIRKHISIDESMGNIKQTTNLVKKEIFRKEIKKDSVTVPILWDRLQKKALVKGKLAFIIGPPGSGKTILMVEKVKSILSSISATSVEDRILIICGRNEALQTLLTNSREYLFEECLNNPEKLLVFTESKFNMWCEEQKKLDNSVRFQHIFIDEWQDFERDFWMNILNFNMSISVIKNRHFWVLRDRSQNLPKCIKPNWDLVTDVSDFWKQKENYFTPFYLKYIFRCTQNQLLSFIPFMREFSCSYCHKKDENKESSQKFVCSYCQPWLGTDTTGPETLFIPDLLDTVPFPPDNIADIIMSAFITTWRKFSHENYDECHTVVLKRLFSQGRFNMTAILTDNPDLIRVKLKEYFEAVGIIGLRCCSAAEFFKENEANRKSLLIVENHVGFKGLESTVVIILNPFNDLTSLRAQHMMNFVVSFSRANCLNVVITTQSGKEGFNELYTKPNSKIGLCVKIVRLLGFKEYVRLDDKVSFMAMLGTIQ